MKPIAAGPVEVSVYLTDRCNLACSFCKRQVQGTSSVSSPDFTAEMAKKIITTYPTIRAACIAGWGEPLLSPHFVDVCRTFNEHNFYVGLITNGTMIQQNSEWFDLVKVNYVSVSLNAASEQEYLENTGSTLWNKVLQGIKTLQSKNIECRVSFVIGKSKIERIPSYIQLARKLGIDQAIVHNILPHGSPDDPSFLSEVLTKEDTLTLNQMNSLLDTVGVPLTHRPRPISLTETGTACDSPFTMIGVNGGGQVGGCRRVLGPETTGMSAFDSTFWAGTYMRGLRESVESTEKQWAVCRKCFGSFKP